jgi:Ser/Thr protein kinase RdoA (MazF antagonist)
MQPVFPAVYSTLSPSALASSIQQKYGLEGVQCQFIVRGVGDTYLIESGSNRSILRVYRSSHRNFKQIKAEVDLLMALKEAGVSVSYPIADLSGTTIQSLEAVEGTRHAVLFTYAPGHSVTRLNKNQLRNLGHQMARFHNVSSTIQLDDGRWNFDLETTLFKPLEMIKPAFADDQEGYKWLLMAAKQVEKRLADLDTSGFSAGYCHFDFLPKNFHFEGDAVTLFDFDFMGYGWLANDIMSFWQHLCLDVRFGRMTQDEADTSYQIFLEAYNEYRPLKEYELIAVPYLMLGFWLFYSGFHITHDQFYPYVQPAHLKPRLALIRYLMEKYWDKEYLVA